MKRYQPTESDMRTYCLFEEEEKGAPVPYPRLAAWLLWSARACCLGEFDQHVVERFTITVHGIYIRCRGMDHYFMLNKFHPRRG